MNISRNSGENLNSDMHSSPISYCFETRTGAEGAVYAHMHKDIYFCQSKQWCDNHLLSVRSSESDAWEVLTSVFRFFSLLM